MCPGDSQHVSSQKVGLFKGLCSCRGCVGVRMPLEETGGRKVEVGRKMRASGQEEGVV